MCMILDANAAHQIFAKDRPPAGKAVFDWIDCGKGKLIVGGKLLHELDQTGLGEWLRGAILAGNAKRIANEKVYKEAQILEDRGLRSEDRRLRSDDSHVIALARLGGARLLYSNDKKLHQDFKNKNLIDKPRGKIYPYSGELTEEHRRLLREGVCPD